MNGDVTVVGTVMGSHVIEDIGYTVPQGIVVTIPADIALRSKDLWRALSQNQLLRLHNGPINLPPRQAPPPPPIEVPITPQTEQLLEAIKRERAENQDLRRALADQTGVLKQILGAIQQGTLPQRAAAATKAAHKDASESDAPTFIPSEITPKDAWSRIAPQSDEQQADNVTDAASKLRTLRGQQ